MAAFVCRSWYESLQTSRDQVKSLANFGLVSHVVSPATHYVSATTSKSGVLSNIHRNYRASIFAPFQLCLGNITHDFFSLIACCSPNKVALRDLRNKIRTIRNSLGLYIFLLPKKKAVFKNKMFNMQAWTNTKPWWSFRLSVVVHIRFLNQQIIVLFVVASVSIKILLMFP